MFPPRWADFLPAKLHFRQTLAAQHAGLLAGSFTAVPAEPPPDLRRERLRIHFWAPNPWPSTAIHVERVLPQLRSQAAALDLPWQITSGGLPDAPVDWLLCLKAIPPAGRCPIRRTVLLLPDDADRFWSRLKHFGHVVSVSSPVFASLLGIVHPHVWFIEETEAPDVIETGQRALDRAPSSQRTPTVLWHGTRESLDGLYALKDALTAFGDETQCGIDRPHEPSGTHGAMEFAAGAICRVVAQSPDRNVRPGPTGNRSRTTDSVRFLSQVCRSHARPVRARMPRHWRCPVSGRRRLQRGLRHPRRAYLRPMARCDAATLAGSGRLSTRPRTRALPLSGSITIPLAPQPSGFGSWPGALKGSPCEAARSSSPRIPPLRHGPEPSEPEPNATQQMIVELEA